MRPAALALVALALASAGCRTSVVPGCRRICTCAPCTDHDLDVCVDKAQKAEDTAYAKGCADAFDTFVDCFEQTVSCQEESTPGTTTRCSHAQSALALCSGAGNPFATVCQEAAEKLDACSPGTMNVPQSPCTGQNACQAACTLAASCDVLVHGGSDPTFGQCVNDCFSKVSPPPPE